MGKFVAARRTVILRAVAATAVCGALMFLTGCATAGASASPASAAASEASSGPVAPGEAPIYISVEEGHSYAVSHKFDLMAEILSDGAVTREEYQRAFTAKVECQTRAGWTFVGEPVWNPSDNLMLIQEGRPSEATPSAEVAAARLACTNQFEFISYTFQKETTPVMDPPLLAAVQACLTTAGVPFDSAATSLPGMVGTEASNGPHFDAINGCVVSNIKKLYPDIPGYGLSF